MSDLNTNILEAFNKEYKYAHQAILDYTKAFKEINITGAINFRDGLSHLLVVLDNGTNIKPEEREEHLICMREHMRRAAVDGYQEHVQAIYEQAAVEYMHYRSHYMPYELQFGIKDELRQTHDNIKKGFKQLRITFKECREGKNGKGWEDGILRMKQACKEADALHKLIQEIIANITPKVESKVI